MPDRTYTDEELEDAVRACLMDIVPDVDAFVVRAAATPDGRRYVRLGAAGRDLEVGVMVYLPRRPFAAADIPRLTRFAYENFLRVRAERPGHLVDLDYT